jgi:hypothetical protein
MIIRSHKQEGRPANRRRIRECHCDLKPIALLATRLPFDEVVLVAFQA